MTQDGIHSASNSNVQYQVIYCDPSIGLLGSRPEQGQQLGQSHKVLMQEPRHDGFDTGADGYIRDLASANATLTGWRSLERLNDKRSEGSRPQT